MPALALASLLGCQQPVSPPVRVPPVRYAERVLPNGLRVYAVLDASSPDVTVQLWYDVGSKDDPAGRSGFAHLFEHMMFKGRGDTAPEYLDRLTESVGGVSNASTTEDYTEYHEVVPADQLQRMLRIEASRMGGLVVSRKDFLTERAVVEAELREDLPDGANGAVQTFDISEALFPGYPNNPSGAGSIKDLQAATLDDVRAFHRAYYRPDKAVLVVAGRFSPTQLDRWVDRYFGPVSRPVATPPDLKGPPSVRPAAREIEVEPARGDAPWVVLAYPAPRAAAEPAAAALTVLQAIMGLGTASRAYTSLVHDRQLAEDVFSDIDLRRDAGVVYFGATVPSGAGLAHAASAMRREIVELQNRRVSQRELAAAKTQLLAGALADRQTIEGLASEIGRTAIVEGDVAHVNTDLAAIETVTADDVERVARAYLTDDRLTTIRSRDSANTAPGSARHMPSRGRAEACVRFPRRPTTIAPVAWRGFTTQAPPAPPSPRAFERTLSNGLRVIVAPQGRALLASALLTVRGGAAMDPPRQAGLADLTASLALAGAAGLSRTQLAARMDGLGLSLTREVDDESSTLGFTAPAQSLADGLSILRDVVRQPALGQAEFRRLLRLKSGQVPQATPDLDAMTDTAAEWLVFGKRPGPAPLGVSAPLGQTARKDVLALHRRLYRPDNTILVLTGKVEAPAAFAMAERLFGSWTNPPGAPPKLAPHGPAPSARVWAIDAPEAGEAEVAVVGRAVARADPSRAAAEVANGVLGGSYTSRLDQEIRVRRGLTYEAASDIDDSASGEYFSARAKTETCRAPEVATLMLAELAELGERGPSADELAVRKAALTGDFLRTGQTTENLAELLMQNALAGAQARELAAYPEMIRAVGLSQVRAAAARLASPENMKILVIGDTRRFLPELRRRFGRVAVVSSGELGATGGSARHDVTQSQGFHR
jgi:zinc protease